MNRVVANELLSRELSAHSESSHKELAKLVGKTSSAVKRGDDGNTYNLEISVAWGNDQQTSIKVSGSIALADWGAPHDRLDNSIVVTANTSKTRVP